MNNTSLRLSAENTSPDPAPICSNDDDDECSLCTNFNGYATKKSLGQGFLDAALLSANGSQLRTLLGLEHRHEFYTLVLALIVTSIGLQIIQALLTLYLGYININKLTRHKMAKVLNNAISTIAIVTLIVNAIIPIFDNHKRENKEQPLAAEEDEVYEYDE